MHYHIIEQQSDLDEFIEKIRIKNTLAIDTEFMRRRTLYPEIALIQVYDTENIGLIDPLKDLDLSGFWQLMVDNSILKVLHSPSEDLEVFQKFGSCVPAPLFDTQFALCLMGEGQSIGFAKMVEHFLAIEVDKSESRTNWLQRPLTKKQLDYAASDVYYLMPCFEKIIKEIREKNWFDFVIQESALMAKKRAYQVPDNELYLNIKNAWQLAPKDLAVLKYLSAWRKNKAIKKNLALGFILKEANMVEIARRKPISISALKKIPDIEIMEVNKSGKEILECVKKGMELDSTLWPEKIKRLVDFPGYKQTVKDIKQQLTKVASEHAIPLEAIASKKQINQLISWKWKSGSIASKQKLTPDLLCQWRHVLVEETLQDWINK